MSFGVGNEAGRKGAHRPADRLSVLQAHPTWYSPSVRGNDGPGLSTAGIPRIRQSSAHRQGDIPRRDGLGATTRQTSDPVAYFSAPGRGTRQAGHRDAGAAPIPRCLTGMWAMSGRAAPAWPRLMPPDSPRCSPRPSRSAGESTPV